MTNAADISGAYFERNFADKHLTEIPPNDMLRRLVTSALSPDSDDHKVTSALEFGCGSGHNLRWLKHQYMLDRARIRGVEPNMGVADAVTASGIPCEFGVLGRTATLDRLRDRGGMYSIVVACMVLHWVPRGDLLVALGSLCALADPYVAIVDFAPKEAFRVPFKHHPGRWTYHQRYAPILQAAGWVVISSQFYGTDNPMDTIEAVLLRRPNEVPPHCNSL